jgi:hypothetical protein
MDRMTATMPERHAVVHVDLDGATHIYRAHGWSPTFKRDALFASGLRRLLTFLGQRNITATLFVIAEDLADREKRALILDAAAAGHEIASHTMTHRHLTRLSPDERMAELRNSRDALEQALGRPVTGLRAPGFLVDRDTLAMAAAAGYQWDSSAFHGFRAPAGAIALGHGDLAVAGLRELAMPPYDGLPCPFHPSYSQLLGTRYFRAGLDRALKSTSQTFVFLIHLTDLADPMPASDLSGWASRLYTLSVLSAATKERRLARMLDMVQARCSLIATNTLMTVHPETTGA